MSLTRRPGRFAWSPRSTRRETPQGYEAWLAKGPWTPDSPFVGVPLQLDEAKQRARELGQEARTAAALAGKAWEGVGQSLTDIFATAIAQTRTWSDLLGNVGRLLGQLAVNALGFVAGGQGGFGDFFRGLAGRNQYGGPVFSSQPYLVGERGPELFVPRTAGNIVRNDQLSSQGGPAIGNLTLQVSNQDDYAVWRNHLIRALPEIEEAVAAGQAQARRY